MKEALEEISKTKRQRYEAWRRSTLGGLKLGRRIVSALMWTIIPAVVCLQASRFHYRHLCFGTLVHVISLLTISSTYAPVRFIETNNVSSPVAMLQVGRAGLQMQDVKSFVSTNVNRVRRLRIQQVDRPTAVTPVEIEVPAAAPVSVPAPVAMSPQKKGWSF